MASQAHGVRRPTSDTNPEEICLVCKNAVILRWRPDAFDSEQQACSDPDCLGAHGYELSDEDMRCLRWAADELAPKAGEASGTRKGAIDAIRRVLAGFTRY